MSFVSLFVIIILYIFFDVHLLKKGNKELFVQVFRLPRWFILFYVILLCLPILLKQSKGGFLPAIILCLSFYYYKRYRFIQLSRSPSLMETSANFLAIDSSGIILFWFIAMVLLSTVLELTSSLFPSLESELGESALLSLFSSLFIVFFIYKTVKKYQQIDFLDSLGLRRGRKTFMQGLVYPILLGGAFATFSSLIILLRTDQPSTPFNEVIEATTSAGAFFSFFIIAIFLAPFFEEIIFRGYYYFVLEKYIGRKVAIGIIALLFGFMHFHQYWGDWAAIVIVTFLGFILTLLRAYSGSSWPSIIAHYFYNGGMVVIPIFCLMVLNPSYYEFQTRYYELSFEEKEVLLLESIKRHPRHAESYNDLSWLYVEENKNLPEALFMIDKALSLDADRGAFMDTKAEILYKMGHLQEAIKIEESLVEKFEANKFYKNQLNKFKEAKKSQGQEK